MAVDKQGSIYDGVRGAHITFGTFTLDAANIAADSQGEETVAIEGVRAGDKVFVSPRNQIAGLALGGSWASDTDEITVSLQNTTEAGVNAGDLTYDYFIIHLD